MSAFWRSMGRVPRPTGAPPVGRADRLLVAGFEVAALVESIARPDLAWRPLVTGLTMAVLPVLLWRRSHPLTACLIGFGAAGLLSVVQLSTHGADVGLYAMMAVLILLYALVRWGSGREIALGTAYVAAVVALGLYAAAAGLPDVVGGAGFLLFFVALAAVFRSRAELWQRQEREIRNAERLALARELHDTVAHHVSAIAVQAQAGGVVAATEPQQAAAVLAAIEAEASRTLAEMRAMVRVLREDGGESDAAQLNALQTYAPQSGIADLTALARTDAVPAVQVSLTGSLTRLPPPVDAAVYRIAQEALTNAVRHAPTATRIDIDVRRVGDEIRLRVTDDGRTPPRTPPRAGAEPGYGLTGMAERAHLLGGSLRAGPRPEGGWAVEALLPATMPT